MESWTLAEVFCPIVALVGLQFERQVDAGAFLTFITLVAGFLAWGFKTVKEWRRDRLQEAKDGALRLILRILRDLGGSVPLGELQERFASAEMKEQRDAYTGRDFRFKNDTEFEAAVYRLDWEGKIDFVSPNDIRFRVDDYDARKMSLVDVSVDDVMRLLDDAVETFLDQDDQDSQSGLNWIDVEDLVRYAMREDPGRTTQLLHRRLEETRARPIQHRALLLTLVRAAR